MNTQDKTKVPIAQEELKTGGMDARSDADEQSMKSGIEPLKLVTPPMTSGGPGGPKFTQALTTQTEYLAG